MYLVLCGFCAWMQMPRCRTKYSSTPQRRHLVVLIFTVNESHRSGWQVRREECAHCSAWEQTECGTNRQWLEFSHRSVWATWKLEKLPSSSYWGYPAGGGRMVSTPRGRDSEANWQDSMILVYRTKKIGTDQKKWDHLAWWGVSCIVVWRSSKLWWSIQTTNGCSAPSKRCLHSFNASLTASSSPFPTS